MSIKARLPILFTVWLMLTSQACSDSNKTDASIRDVSRSAQTPDSRKMDNDLQLRYETMQTALYRENVRLSLENLKETRLSDSETEIRFYVGFGLLFPRCFILKILNGREQGFYVGPQDTNGQVQTDVPKKISVTKVAVGSPKSGWPSFDALLKLHGITSPIELRPDIEHKADPDEEMFLVEVKSGATYSMTFFPFGTQTEDGKKAIALCKIIGTEFAIRLGCGTN